MFAPKKGAPMRPDVGPFYYHPDGKLTLFPPARASKSKKGSDGVAQKATLPKLTPGAKQPSAAAGAQNTTVSKSKDPGSHLSQTVRDDIHNLFNSKGAAAEPQGAAAKPNAESKAKSKAKSKTKPKAKPKAKPKGADSKTVESMTPREFQKYVHANWKSWVQVVSGDGACQFHAFLGNDGYSDADQQEAYELRKEVVAWVTNNPNKSTYEFIDKIVDLRQTVKARVLDEYGLKGKNWKKEYKRLMLVPKTDGTLTYAGELELGAAAIIKGVDVYLFERHLDKNKAPILLQYLPLGDGKGSSRISVLYDRANYNTEVQHYDRYNLPDAVLNRFISDTKERNDQTKRPVKQ